MTDSQILTIAISIVIPISLLIYSNSRVSEVSKRIDDLLLRINDLEKHIDEKIDNAFEHMKLFLELHEVKHHKGEN